ncbi:unnamed protein product [Arabidopsis arenosa]|uniref:RNase H type-1 domain-containing protein n=1 Tax=Arabidopsis arenosa TaxID=38785 RepID=A0A8S2AHG3_ARAAE|nr:unnamed protein product [Arabidopsis arenosa]
MLHRIITNYEEASGQLINKDKSSITFSPKTSKEIRNRVKNQLGITKEGGTGKYLGLPELFGRKKRDLFESIVARIKKKAASWSSKRLSAAGKLIMLKSVLTAIPPYSMSCFQLPIAWHDQSKNAGLGWVVLNRAHEVKSRNCKPVPYIKSSCEAEALCILEAILSLQNHHQDKIIIESDSKVAITAINTRKSPINMIGVIEDILNFAKPFHSISFRNIPRSENTCADDLAKTAIRSMTLGQSTSL